MEISECLRIMQKIEVRKAGERDYYASSVQELNKESIKIDVPLLARRALIPARNEKIFVRFMSGKFIYEFESRLIASHSGTIPSFEIALPKDIKEDQRRTLFRLDIILDAECWLNMTGPPSNASDREEKVIRAKTLDVSGCGARISSYAPLKTGQDLFMVIKFEDIEHLEVRARVIWVERKKIREEAIYYAGLKFIDIPRKTQDNMVRYLFKLQARRRLFEKVGE